MYYPNDVNIRTHSDFSRQKYLEKSTNYVVSVFLKMSRSGETQVFLNSNIGKSLDPLQQTLPTFKNNRASRRIP